MNYKTNKNTFLFLLIIFLLLGLIYANYYKIQNDKIKAIENKIAEEKRIEELNPSEEIFLCIDEEIELDSIERYDDSILKVTNKQDKCIIKGIEVGYTICYIPKLDKKIKVYVSNLYDNYNINNEKEYIPCHAYTSEQAHFLDRALQYNINKAGYNTRAGVLEAARFLSLRLKYRLPYFCENGRLDLSTGHPLADGEGRYYHNGLYLSDDKFIEIQFPSYGPAIWGCELYEMPEKRMGINGIDCSGFISWALYNAGYDPGDIGGGDALNDNKYDLLDLGDSCLLNELDFSKLKAGDFIGYPGHIGMIVGLNDKLYVAQAYYVNGLEVNEYTKEELLASKWKYVILMDSYYKEDGNYNSMW